MTLRTIRFDDAEWQLVPKKATRYQVVVGATHSSSGDYMVARGQAIAIYDDMLAAAPEPPEQPGPAPDLAIMITRLVRQLRKAEPAGGYQRLTDEAMDLLRRHGLQAYCHGIGKGESNEA